MKKNILSTLFFFSCLSLFAQRLTEENSSRIYSFDFNSAAQKITAGGSTSIVSLPLYDGSYALLDLTRKALSDDQPSEVKTFNGLLGENRYPAKFTWTPSGISGIYKDAEGYVYFESVDKRNQELQVYRLKDVSSFGDAICGVLDEMEDKEKLRNLKVTSVSPFPVGSELRTYRMAAAAAAEMTLSLGSKANARDKIVEIINASNLIWELETAITFTLISETTTSMTIIFDDSATDYYSNPETFASASKSQTAFNQMATNGLLAKNLYDVGHTFNIVQTACYVCGQAGPEPCSDNGKARGMTQFQQSASVGIIVNIYVHEVGHQFSAWHTYNAIGGSAASPTFCTGGWSNTAAIEPGSGSTLMAYNTNCSYPTNYVLTPPNLDSYFHVKSLEQIYNSVNNTSAGMAGSCINTTNTGNTPPVANAGSNYTIPKGTPFTLTGSATDANTSSANLTYTWEQFDVAVANDAGALGSSINGVGGYSAAMSTTAPLFRSKAPSSNTSRTFPDINFILNDGNNPADNEGEDLPQVARDINFRFTVRDNETGGGGVDSDHALITVANSGPFEITSQNGPTLWFQGDTKTITWSVNNTDQAPVSCANVNILISYDNGATFSSLLANTPNDGSQSITVPSTPSSQVRIKIEAVGNVFFDINNTNITISDGTCNAETSQILNNETITEGEGASSLNLNLTVIGSVISTVNGEITNSSGSSKLVFKDTNGNCASPYSNSPSHNLISFIASSSSSTTFSIGSGTLPSDNLNLYTNAYDPLNQCTNWVNSSAVESSPGGLINLGTSLVQNLVMGQKYDLRVSGFSTGHIGTYSISVSGGSIYSSVPSDGSPYAYAFVIYNLTSGVITGIEEQANLTAYSSGNYRIYGLSYPGGTDLSSYVGGTFAALQTALGNGTICGSLSSNSKDVTIINCTSYPSPPTVAGVTILAGNTATLNASGCSGTVKWYASASGGSALNTGPSFTTPVLNVSTSYWASCMETCESQTRTEGIITVQQAAYCTAPTLDCSDGDLITNVTLSQSSTLLINRSSGCENNGSVIIDSSSQNLQRGVEYQIEVTKNTQYSDGLAVWLDMNGDNFFSPTELILQKPKNTVATQSALFTIPDPGNGFNGQVRMRVKIDYFADTSDPCSIEDPDYGVYGEIEDYIITLGTPSPCPNTLSLVSTTDDITNGTQTFQTSNVNAPGLIQATNMITGGNTTYDAGMKVEMNPGFSVENAVFEAKIGGCN